jgi:hypothetical protein
MTIKGEKIILRPYRQSDLEPLFEGANEPTGHKLTGTQTTYPR